MFRRADTTDPICCDEPRDLSDGLVSGSMLSIDVAQASLVGATPSVFSGGAARSTSDGSRSTWQRRCLERYGRRAVTVAGRICPVHFASPLAIWDMAALSRWLARPLS